MQHEIAIYNNELDTKDTTDLVFKAIKNNNIDGISVLPNYVSVINKYLPASIYLSTPVDYPMGILTTKTRNSLVSTVSKYGLNYIDLMAHTGYLANKDFAGIEKDIISNMKIAEDNGTKLRVFFEYRKFAIHIVDFAQMMEYTGVEYFFPSTGWSIDNSYDNILAAHAFRSINGYTKIICNGNIWTKEHYDNYKKFAPHGLRFHYLSNIQLISGV